MKNRKTKPKTLMEIFSKTSAIKHCPFCGNQNATVREEMGAGLMWRVSCHGLDGLHGKGFVEPRCSASGPVSRISESDAVKRWNQRSNNDPR